MTPAPATQGDGRSLVDAYEALRREENGFDGNNRLIQGRALLMFKGMAAWMKRMMEVSEHSPATTPIQRELQLPAGLERNIVNVIVNMAFVTAREAYNGTDGTCQSTSAAP